MAAVVQQTQKSEGEIFLTKVEVKFRTLLEQSPNPQAEIQEAVERMESEGLLTQRPWENASPRQAAFQMIGDNEALMEWWTNIRESGTWEAASTPQELISALMPDHETLE